MLKLYLFMTKGKLREVHQVKPEDYNDYYTEEGEYWETVKVPKKATGAIKTEYGDIISYEEIMNMYENTR